MSINFKVEDEWKQENGKYKCPHCDVIFSKMGIISHYYRKHDDRGIELLKKISEKRSLNKKIKLKISKKEISSKISKALKKCHNEGRHPGWSFINKDKNRRSYPEMFFFKIIETNEWLYKYNIEEKFNIGKYFLDFAIIDLKLDIEIDGCQHYRSSDAIEHDKRRNEYLISNGWKVYRICWKNFKNNVNVELEELKIFIDNIENNIERYYNIDEIKIPKVKKFESKDDYIKFIKEKAISDNKEKCDLILNSDVDFSSFGWVKKVAKILGIKEQLVNRFMKKYMNVFYENKCFKRGIDFPKQYIKKDRVHLKS